MYANTMLVGAAAALIVVAPVGAGERRSQPVWASSLVPVAFEIATNERDAPDADNTGRNVRDRDGTTRTPTDQGSSESDLNITSHIRKAIVANDALSTNAHNVKIITTDGVVTLRGPVKSAEEKATVGVEAERAPGVKRVDNLLEIERKN